VAIVEYLKQVLRLEAGQGITEPVVEDEKLDPGESIQESRTGAVGVRDLSLVQEEGGMRVAAIEVLAHAAWARTGRRHPSESMDGMARIVHFHTSQPELGELIHQTRLKRQNQQVGAPTLTTRIGSQAL
jgi:hypothetical protein